MQNFSYSLRHFLSIFATGIIPLFLLFFVLDEIIYSLFGVSAKLEESILNFMKNNQIILSIFSIPIVMMVGYTMNAISHFFETMPIMNLISQNLKNIFLHPSIQSMFIGNFSRMTTEYFWNKASNICKNILCVIYFSRLFFSYDNNYNKLDPVHGFYILLRSNAFSFFMFSFIYFCVYGWRLFALLFISSFLVYILSILVELYMHWQCFRYIVTHPDKKFYRKFRALAKKACCPASEK